MGSAAALPQQLLPGAFGPGPAIPALGSPHAAALQRAEQWGGTRHTGAAVPGAMLGFPWCSWSWHCWGLAGEMNTRGRPASPPEGRFAIKHPLPAQTSARASSSSPEPETQKCGFLAIPGTFHFPSPAPRSPRPPLRAVSLPPLPPAESLISCPFHVSPPDRSCPRRSFWGQEHPFSVAGRIFISAPSFLGKQPLVFGCSEPGAVSPR